MTVVRIPIKHSFPINVVPAINAPGCTRQLFPMLDLCPIMAYGPTIQSLPITALENTDEYGPKNVPGPITADASTNAVGCMMVARSTLFRSIYSITCFLKSLSNVIPTRTRESLDQLPSRNLCGSTISTI